MIQSIKSKHVVHYSEVDLSGMSDLPVSTGLTTPGWYFWDETGAFAHGPYATEDIAITDLGKYAEYLCGEE